MPSGVRLTQKEVEQRFNKEGYTLLSQFKTSKDFISFICPNGHQHEIVASNFFQGQRCGKCATNQRLSQKEVEDAFEKEGYTLLTEYEGRQKLLNFICPEGHQHKINFNNFKSGLRCSKCRGYHLTQNQIKLIFEKEGYKLLGEYKKAKLPLDFICPKGHIHKMTLQHFMNGVRCGKCHQETHTGFKIFSYYRIFHRTLVEGKSKIEKEKLKEITNFIQDDIQDIYDQCPKGYSVDHLVPFSFFDHSDVDQIYDCWDRENLRYLPYLENISRGNRLTKEEYVKMNDKQKYILFSASNKPLFYHDWLDK